MESEDKSLLRRSSISTHYYHVSARHIHPVSPGQWLLMAWRLDPAAPAARHLSEAVRRGCQEGRYWLRAYAAVPGRLALLLYPLEDAAKLLAGLEAIAGGAPERLRAIKDDADLERAARYVEALPVRSRLAERPEDYPWSSIGWIGEFNPGGARPRTA